MSIKVKWYLSGFILFLLIILIYPCVKDYDFIKNNKINDTTISLNNIDTVNFLLDSLNISNHINNFIDDYYHDADSLLKLIDTIDNDTYYNFINVINKFNNHIDSVSNNLNIKNNRIFLYNKYKKSIDSTFKQNNILEKNSTKKYHIIIGSFKIKENAEKLINQYDNNSNLTIIKKGELYNVSLMSFSTLEETKNNLLWLKENSTHKNCWILKF